MNLMFWKKKRDPTEDGEDDAQNMSDDIIESHESPKGDAHHDEISEDTDAETGNDSTSGSKLLLIMGAIAGILILLAAGFFTVKFFLSSHKQNHTPAATKPAPSSGNQLIKLPPIGFRQAAKAQPDSHTTDIGSSGEKNDETPVAANAIASSQADSPPVASHPANIDAPAKKDSELQAQAAPQKNRPQPSVLPDTHTIDNSHALSSTPDGDLVVGSKSPESTAIALKKMIDAMNAGSDASPENAAR
jgi:hypothetical protein